MQTTTTSALAALLARTAQLADNPEATDTLLALAAAPVPELRPALEHPMHGPAACAALAAALWPDELLDTASGTDPRMAIDNLGTTSCEAYQIGAVVLLANRPGGDERHAAAAALLSAAARAAYEMLTADQDAGS